MEEHDIEKLGKKAAINTVHRVGCEFRIRGDFKNMISFLQKSEVLANPTFDPNFVDIGKNDFWIGLSDRSTGSLVACSSERLFHTEDFMSLADKGYLWDREGFKKNLGLRGASSRLSGRITHSGATFVAPEYRGGKLAEAMVALTRTIMAQRIAFDFNTGFLRENRYRSGLAKKAYWYTNTKLVYSGLFPPTGQSETLYICYMTRREFIEALRNNVDIKSCLLI